MSVDRRDYIVYGWKLPYELINAKTGEEIDMYEGKIGEYMGRQNEDDYMLISDGMSGDYNVFGKLIKEGGEEWEGWDFELLDIGIMNPEEAKTKYREVFELEDSESVAEPYLFIFSHFT